MAGRRIGGIEREAEQGGDGERARCGGEFGGAGWAGISEGEGEWGGMARGFLGKGFASVGRGGVGPAQI